MDGNGGYSMCDSTHGVKDIANNKPALTKTSSDEEGSP